MELEERNFIWDRDPTYQERETLGVLYSPILQALVTNGTNAITAPPRFY